MVLSIVVYFNAGCSFAQNKEKNIELVKNFSEAIFDKNVEPETIVEKYMFANHNSKNLDSMRLKVSKHIEIARSKLGQEGGWLMPGNSVANEKTKHIESFLDVEKLNKLQLNLPEDKKKNVYVLLNSNKDEILQYFYVENSKISSFSMFVKTNKAWFFRY